MKTSNPLPWPRKVLTYCGGIPAAGVLDFDESFNSCITATLTLFLSNTTLSYVSLLPIPLALNCRTLNVLSSLIYSVDGAAVGDCEGGGGVDCRVFKAEQGSQVQSLFLRYCAAFKSTFLKVWCFSETKPVPCINCLGKTTVHTG